MAMVANVFGHIIFGVFLKNIFLNVNELVSKTKKIILYFKRMVKKKFNINKEGKCAKNF